MTDTNDNRSQPLTDLLSAVTDAILADQADLDTVLSRYAVNRSEVEPLVVIVRRLHVALVGVRPSRRFVTRLRTELLGDRQVGMISRIRYLPPRVQIAALVAVIAGFMLLSRGRMLIDARRSAAALVDGTSN